MIYHEKTGFPMGDPEKKIFSLNESFNKEEKEKFLKNSIFSVSGWRRVFAIDGNEESTNPEIGTLDKLMVAGAARLFAEFMVKTKKIQNPVITVGLDSRHTGPEIGIVIIRALLGYGCDVKYIFIASAPEIMSYTKTSEKIDGFMYVSASHNPIGHNGLKFGLRDGAVLGKTEAQPIIDKFLRCFFDEIWVNELIDSVNNVAPSQIKDIFGKVDIYKNEAMKQYASFTDLVITGIEDDSKRNKMLGTIKSKIQKIGIGVLAELNGSARAVSIDKPYLSDFSVNVTAINDKPRQIVHRIVPEGLSLDLARRELEKLFAQDTRYRFAYVPDCDGDRGNVVTISNNGKSNILEAQEVFALSTVSELSYLVYAGKLTYDNNGNPEQKVAVVVNDPTSGRIDRIAEAFGAEVFRAEVGEANVVSLAQKKQKEGYIVRILGEGSNGGNITFPSTVRDPINTIFAFIKMLVLRSEKDKPGLFEIWCSRSNQMDKFHPDAELFDIIATLPIYTTTSAFDDMAIVKIKTEDHAELKANYEHVFLKEWNENKNVLKIKLGVIDYQVVNYEGTETLIGMGSQFRTGAQKGGFKIIFLDKNNGHKAFIWMRGSGTEPVFRVLADVEGKKPDEEKYLLNWHISMIEKADMEEAR